MVREARHQRASSIMDSPADPGPVARYANLILGVWLFVSAFLWSHSPPSRTNTWILGLIIAFLSLSAMRTLRARYANTAAATWLFFSTLAITHYSRATVWNNSIVAVLVFLFSLVPNRGLRAA
jgi:hypothetical protein